mgnify:CR=1 FL=1
MGGKGFLCTFCFATGREEVSGWGEGGSSRLRTFLYTVEFTRKFQPFNKEGARNLMKDSQFLRGILHHFFIQNFPLKFSEVTASRVFLCRLCTTALGEVAEPEFRHKNWARDSTKSRAFRSRSELSELRLYSPINVLFRASILSKTGVSTRAV